MNTQPRNTQHSRRVQRTIVGPAEHLQNVLETADRQGRLVAVTPPRPYSPGTFAVTAVMLETGPLVPAQRPARRRVVHRRYKVAAVAVTAVLAALAALGALLALVVSWLVAHLALILGAALILAVLAFVLRAKTGACMGLHCEGCGH